MKLKTITKMIETDLQIVWLEMLEKPKQSVYLYILLHKIITMHKLSYKSSVIAQP